MARVHFIQPHRLGIFALNHPFWGSMCLLVILGLSVWGMSMIKSNFAIASMFAADNEQFTQYKRFKQTFPLNDRDVLIVVRTNEINRERLETVRLLHLDLELFDGVDGVISAFSLPEPSEKLKTRFPHFTEELPSGSALAQLVDDFSTNEVSNKFLGKTSDGRTWMVLVTTFASEAIGPHTVLPKLAELDAFLREQTAGSGLQYDLVGVPILEGMFKTGGRSDRRIFNMAGLLIGLVVSIFLLRDLRFVAMVFFCPVLSVIATYGAMGLAGREFSLLMGAAPPLIMVIAFANAMHLVKPIMSAMQGGEYRDVAAKQVLEEVGPSCFLAMATTGLALFSLIVSASGAVRDFAVISSIGMAMIFLVCVLIVPLFARLLLPTKLRATFKKPDDVKSASWTFRLADKIAVWIPAHQTTVLAASVALLAVLSISYVQLTVKHRLSDEVPRNARAVILEVNQDIATTSPYPLFIAIRYPPNYEAAAPQVLSVLEQLHAEIGTILPELEIWSTLSLRSGLSNEVDLAKVLQELPPQIANRFLNRDEHTHLATLYIENLDSASIMALVSKLRPALDRITGKNPGFEFTLTGISLISADHATTTIPKLHASMWFAITIVFVFICLFFRSVSIALFAILPNVLPIVATGAILHISGWGLGYASVIALTVAFGVAVDDTIHFLRRYQLQRQRGEERVEAVVHAIRDIGPVVITTSVVLVLGLSATAFGQMPHTRVFGILCCVTLIVALFADLFVLPAVILAWHRVRTQLQERFKKLRLPPGA